MMNAPTESNKRARGSTKYRHCMVTPPLNNCLGGKNGKKTGALDDMTVWEKNDCRDKTAVF
jgi:hypothetical protein